jgi:hypothetical protein
MNLRNRKKRTNRKNRNCLYYQYYQRKQNCLLNRLILKYLKYQLNLR